MPRPLSTKQLLTSEQVEFVKGSTCSVLDLTKDFNKQFGTSYSYKAMREIYKTVFDIRTIPNRNCYNKKLSPAQIEFIKAHTDPCLSATEFARLYNNKFGTSISKITAIRMRLFFCPGFSFNMRAFIEKTGPERRDSMKFENTLSPAQIDFIKSHAKYITVSKLANQFNKKFGTSFSDRAMNARCRHFCPDFRAKAIHKTPLPIGEDRLFKKSGRTLVKVAPEKWKFKHIILWEEHSGKPVPTNHRIIFKDGDTKNITIENLIELNQGQLNFLSRNGYLNKGEEILNIGLLLYEISKLRIKLTSPGREKWARVKIKKEISEAANG